MVSKEHDFLHYLKTGDMELTADLGIPTMRPIRFKTLTEPDMIGFNYATASSLPGGREKKDCIVHFSWLTTSLNGCGIILSGMSPFSNSTRLLSALTSASTPICPV